MNQVVIGLGSNIDPQKNIEQAKTILYQTYHVVKESQFIATKPIGYKDQPDFMNGSILIHTEFDILTLKQQLKDIEKKLGRTYESKFYPLTIDLDIIIWNDIVKDVDFYNRPFLKDSVKELIPNFQY